jgi:hypothetical protein
MVGMVMKTAFTFKRWYWGYGHDPDHNDPDQPPQWWTNFVKGKEFHELYKELSTVAKVRYKPNGSIRVVFNSPSDLSFFILRYS